MRFARTDFTQYLADPVGRYACGPSWLYWQANPDIGGLILRGYIDAAAARDIAHSVSKTLMAPRSPRFLAFFDVRNVLRVDPQAVLVIAKELATRRADDVQFAPICSASLEVSALVGLVQLLLQMDMHAPCSDYDVAVARGLITADIAMAVAEVIRENEPLSVRERLLRALLAAPFSVRIEAMAQTVGMSPRSLQRALASEGTSYRELVAEVRRSHLRRSVTSTDKLDAVAAELGLRSVQSLSTTFRRLIGESPSDFRLARSANSVAPTDE